MVPSGFEIRKIHLPEIKKNIIEQRDLTIAAVFTHLQCPIQASGFPNMSTTVNIWVVTCQHEMTPISGTYYAISSCMKSVYSPYYHICHLALSTWGIQPCSGREVPSSGYSHEHSKNLAFVSLFISMHHNKIMSLCNL